MQFAALANTFAQLEAIRSGTKMREILSSFFKKVPAADVSAVAHLLRGEIASEFEDVLIGMADKMVIRAIAAAIGKDDKTVEAASKKKGDVGLVAEALVGKAKGALSVKDVFTTLHQIAGFTGSGSQEKKIYTLASLLKKASPQEAKYIARICVGKLRLGAGTMTLLDSLAIAYTGNKEARKELEQAYNICPDISIVAEAIAKHGLPGVRKVDIVVGRPIQMMLAQRVKHLEEITERMKHIAAEEKYDGERIQVHRQGEKIFLFSRRLENITNQFPDVVQVIRKQASGKSFVIEGEVVPVDKNGNLLPFQILMQRRRKYDVEAYVKKIPICFYLFDLLYLNGKSYLHASYPNRRKALERIIKPTASLQLARQIITTTIDDVSDFFQKSLKRGCEGILAKSCEKDSIYRAGARAGCGLNGRKSTLKKCVRLLISLLLERSPAEGSAQERMAHYFALPIIQNKKDMKPCANSVLDLLMHSLPRCRKSYQNGKYHPAQRILLLQKP
ncbi:ATP-dependent DNA ligase [Candidatus Woesearchaeota archaeon]|nr:ATP-dependent DNA ligase [Candidatus Woesearchaeota archaeon]